MAERVSTTVAQPLAEFTVDGEVVQWFAIGAAHPQHPGYPRHYTADGVDRREPDAEKYRMAFNGYGDSGMLTKVLKSEIRLELPL